MAEARIVIELVIGGAKIFLDTKNTPGLVESVKPVKSFDWKSPNAAPRRVGLQFVAPQIDVPRLVRDGMILGGTGKITIIDTQGRSRIYMEGVLDEGVAYSTVDKSISIVLADNRIGMSTTVPREILDTDKFSTMLPEMNSIGARVNYVFGTVSGMPVRQVANVDPINGFVYVAGQAGLNVTIMYNDEKRDWTTVPPGGINSAYQDDRGNSLTIAYTGSVTTPAEVGDPMWATVIDTGSATNVFKLCSDISDMHGGSVSVLDNESWAKARSKADPSLNVHGFISEAALLIDVLENNIFRQFPMMHGYWDSKGYGCLYVDRRAPPVLDLVAGTGLLPGRVSTFTEVARSTWYNKFTLNYRWHSQRGMYSYSAAMDENNSTLCKIGKELSKQEIEHPPLDCPWIRDFTVAEKVLAWMAAHYSLPSYRVRYIGHPDLFNIAHPGDSVSLTDDEQGWVKEQAVIELVEMTEMASTEIVFRVWPSRFSALGG